MRKLDALLLLGPVVLVSACAADPPSIEWRDPETVTVPLATTWPPTVKVTLDGKDKAAHAKLMVDTGAEESAIDERIADWLELGRTWRLSTVEGFAEEQGGVGHHVVFPRKLAGLEVQGACRLEGLSVLPLPGSTQRDGVLALGAFRGRALLLDPVARRVSFVPRERVEALAHEEGAVSVPVHREGKLLVAEVEIGDQQNRRFVDMVLDTGAQDSFVTDAALEGAQHVRLGGVDLGQRLFRLEHGGDYSTLGGGVLLDMDRAILFDMEGSRVVLLVPRVARAGATWDAAERSR